MGEKVRKFLQKCPALFETFCENELVRKHHDDQRRMLIIGTGFLAKVFHQTIDTFDWDIDVWGSADFCCELISLIMKI